MEKFDKETRTINTLTVHAGTFHSDDVFCGAVAQILNPKAVIRRVSKADTETDIEKGNIVADIGFGPFDHHQKDCPYREDGIKHCGASRLWLVYGMTAVKKVVPEISDEAAAAVCQGIYDGMLRTIAALDNGTADFPNTTFSIVNAVEGFRPEWDSEKTYDQGYFEAVAFVKQVLINEINAYAAEARAAYVMSRVAAKEKGIVILEKYCPWKKPVIADKEAEIVIYPSLRGGWNLEPVPNEKEEITYRIHIPDEWRGTVGEAAAACQPGMTFCHAKGFLVSFETEDYAVRAAEELVRGSSAK